MTAVDIIFVVIAGFAAWLAFALHIWRRHDRRADRIAARATYRSYSPALKALLGAEAEAVKKWGVISVPERPAQQCNCTVCRGGNDPAPEAPKPFIMGGADIYTGVRDDGTRTNGTIQIVTLPDSFFDLQRKKLKALSDYLETPPAPSSYLTNSIMWAHSLCGSNSRTDAQSVRFHDGRAGE